MPGSLQRRLHSDSDEIEPATGSAHCKPDHLSGSPLTTSLDVQTYQDPEHVSTALSNYPAITGCEHETFTPLLEASPTTENADSASGLNLILSAQQFEGFAASPSEIKSAIVSLPPGLTVNPDAADGQSKCTDAQVNFGSEGPAECPDNAKIGTFAIGSPTLNAELVGSIYIGEPKPDDQYRLFLTASGFGINVKLVGSLKPRPGNGAVDRLFRKPPTGSIRNLPSSPLCRRTGPDGDPDGLHDIPVRCRLHSLGRSACPTSTRSRLSASNLGSPWRPMPRPDPSLPSRILSQVPPTPTPGPTAPSPSSSTAKTVTSSSASSTSRCHRG